MRTLWNFLPPGLKNIPSYCNNFTFKWGFWWINDDSNHSITVRLLHTLYDMDMILHCEWSLAFPKRAVGCFRGLATRGSLCVHSGKFLVPMLLWWIPSDTTIHCFKRSGGNGINIIVIWNRFRTSICDRPGISKAKSVLWFCKSTSFTTMLRPEAKGLNYWKRNAGGYHSFIATNT